MKIAGIEENINKINIGVGLYKKVIAVMTSEILNTPAIKELQDKQLLTQLVAGFLTAGYAEPNAVTEAIKTLNLINAHYEVPF
jgi:hypothetical protein